MNNLDWFVLYENFLKFEYLAKRQDSLKQDLENMKNKLLEIAPLGNKEALKDLVQYMSEEEKKDS